LRITRCSRSSASCRSVSDCSGASVFESRSRHHLELSRERRMESPRRRKTMRFACVCVGIYVQSGYLSWNVTCWSYDCTATPSAPSNPETCLRFTGFGSMVYFKVLGPCYADVYLIAAIRTRKYTIQCILRLICCSDVVALVLP
jgi:hypothetical protein